MLYITRQRKANGQPLPDINWWQGYSYPSEVEKDRVVTFQADGHELAIILNAIKEASRK